MASHGATLQNYNTELVKHLQQIKEKREDINTHIMREENEKSKIENQIAQLTERLSKINLSLKKKQQTKSEFDKTLKQTESAFVKILQSSQTLLHVLKREGANLSKKKESLHPLDEGGHHNEQQ